MRWNVSPSKKPFSTSPAIDAVVQGEVSVASSNVKLPLLVSTTTSWVLPSSRFANSAFDLSPLIAQSMVPFVVVVPVVVVPLVSPLALLPLPPHPTSSSASGTTSAKRLTERLHGPPNESFRDLHLVGRTRQRRGLGQRVR